ncbi:class III lanthionine synthetase LanKC [Curtobacterium sp. NPDC089185]|uniref:class III lanthionine synthetase LanKC n=1 Tax=Curtobacterium sp. NPDC089185 TaxID=3154968 RepID=UPI0034314E97
MSDGDFVDFTTFCSDSSPFYEPDHERSDRISLAAPTSWRSAPGLAWTGVFPAGVRRRTHGWKIHLSLCPEAYEEALRLAAEICFRADVAFKYVPSVLGLIARNAKNANRSASGKAVTIYPTSDDQLDSLAEELHAALRSFEGPYILSDVRFRAGPVHFRYGGFEPLYVERGGRRVAARPDANGMLVEDVRGPRFDEPAGVHVPDCVAEAIADYRRSPTDNPLLDFRSIEPLQFSNAGGVYLAAGEDGKLTVLKEARRSAGVDANGRSARQRLQTEHRNLQVLDGTGIAPEPLRLFGVLEHAFLEMEFLGGQTLSARTVAELPELRARGHRGAVAATYADVSTEIARGLFEAVELAHNCGVVVGDLHPSNVMLSPALRVRLIDLEDHREPHERGRSPFNALGYRAPDGLDAAASDWYAFTRTVASMFDPSFARELLAPHHWQSTLERVREQGTAELAELLAEGEARAGGARGRRAFAVQGVEVSTIETSGLAPALRRGIRQSRRPGASRRFPGDPRGTEGFARMSCAFGLAGVLLAQLRLGEVPEPADLDFLAGAAQGTDRIGAFDGLSGAAYVLAAAGRTEEAHELLERVRLLAPASDDCSLATGLSGAALALRALDAEFACELQDIVLGRVSSGSATIALDASPGLLGGWTGIALTLALSPDSARSASADEAARRALGRDCDQIRRSSAGTIGLRETDGDRVFPYLANGTAGVLLTLTTMRRRGLVGENDALWTRNIDRLVESCAGGVQVFDGLFHGIAGLLLALRSAIGLHPEVGELVVSLHERLARRSFSWRGEVHMAGDGCLRLSSDLATGSAGVLLSLPTTPDPLAWIPARTAPENHTTEGR